MGLKESILLVDYVSHELKSKDNPLFIPIITLFFPIREARLHYSIRYPMANFPLGVKSKPDPLDQAFCRVAWMDST
jgi:hypothetical protein